MSNRSFRTGDTVALSHAQTIPVRYRGRTGFVTGRERFRNGFRYLVEFAGRRANPLPVSARFLTAV